MEIFEIEMQNLFFKSEAESKNLSPGLNLRRDWFHLKLYSMLRELSRRSIETCF